MSLLNKRIKAFTLAESLVSLVIILSVFAVGMLIVTNIIRSDNYTQKLQAQSIISEVYTKTMTEKSYYNKQIKSGEWIINRSIRPGRYGQNLRILYIEVLDNQGHVLATIREFILIESPDED
jgi:type II secretory pathway pseudopilin PulG